MIDYQRVAKAITYIKEHAIEQPNLDDVAEAVHLSPYHFHRMFKEWAGVTPKEFLQYISLNHAKRLLDKNQTIEEAIFHTGLSSSSRLHDLFVNIEGMTPGEFKNQGQSLDIRYHFSESPFGHILVASTGKGIGEYRWGSTRKTAIIGWEAAQIFEENHAQTD
ncbi:Helix-turn-helix domain-containing protein [Fodinibius roseus]|uniref:Helix-turn-helix domain-containing protein n=1 Tax=Fodinibius roseus TaxID=1194090 RepID=A0A1M4YX08_9BACT|nr:AraC family transcriptional regulator [Fodinibius roseus]SHF10349.1 Helix-turn-helix domain-containing protein [Fodinibius roseus]